jgi:DhnA family fructose-bisphosphate aldolase class Ia
MTVLGCPERDGGDGRRIGRKAHAAQRKTPCMKGVFAVVAESSQVLRSTLKFL